MNTSKKNKLYFYVDVVKCPKFDLIVEPREGIIKKGSVGNLTFKIRIFCTTRIYQIGKIYLSHNNPAKSKLIRIRFFNHLISIEVMVAEQSARKNERSYRATSASVS
jgi:hypothetical protein